MNKRTTALIIAICIIVLILSLFFGIPKENWSIMPYVLIPLFIACLVVVIFSVINLIKKTPEIKESFIEESNENENENTENVNKSEES